MNVHSGQKDHRCPECFYATSHKSNLDRHVSRVHRTRDESDKRCLRKRSRFSIDQEDTMSTASFSSDKMSEDSNGPSKPRLCFLPYKCPTCQASFNSQISLVQHCQEHESVGLEEEDENVLMAARVLFQMKYSTVKIVNQQDQFHETI